MQKTLFSITAVLVAGIWGYSGDSFATQVKGWVETIQEDDSADNADLTQNTAEQRGSEPTDAVNANRAFPTATQIRDQRSERFVPPANPYQAMKPGSLQQTLGSITPSDNRPRSNAYFDKLSEQLKELQGESPPPPAPVAAQVKPEKQEADEAEMMPEPEVLPNEPILEDVLQDEALVNELEQILDEEGY